MSKRLYVATYFAPYFEGKFEELCDDLKVEPPILFADSPIHIRRGERLVAGCRKTDTCDSGEIMLTFVGIADRMDKLPKLPLPTKKKYSFHLNKRLSGMAHGPLEKFAELYRLANEVHNFREEKLGILR